MTKNKDEQIAVFRFGVIHEFVGGATLTRDERRRLIRDKCARKWVIPFSNLRYRKGTLVPSQGARRR